MSLDKVLHKIQGQIHDLAPALEVFVDSNIQPSVKDCEHLQQQLTLLQESIAVYKYDKLNKEISPSFNIHAKISAQEKPAEKPVAATPEPEIAEEKIKPEPVRLHLEVVENKIAQPVEATPEPVRTETTARKNALAIGLNDKFRFINSLFSQNASEYNIALEQLGNLHSWSDTEIYLNSLRNLYDWKDNDETAKQFYAVAKKQFS